MKHFRLSLVAVAASLATAAVAQPASASIWTPLASGTTSDITAITYRGGDQFWFGTGNGEIFKRTGATFTRVSNNPGTVIRDIEFQPGGGIGLAVGTNGKVLRTTDGITWTAVTLPALSRSNFLGCDQTAPAGDFDSVRFAGNGRAFIFGKSSQIARSPAGVANPATVGGSGSWVDANKNGSSCFVDADIDDAFFVDGESGYLVSGDFGKVRFTDSHLTSTAASKAADAGNGFTSRRRVAGDASNPNRMWSVTPGEGTSYWRSTKDGWSTSNSLTIPNGDALSSTGGLDDIAASGGTVLAAGSAGNVVHSIDGTNFYVDPAPSPLATADWQAVDLANATDGAIGGRNGALAITTAANTIPDIVKPTGSIAGPDKATAGVPVTFTAAVADNAGGAGLDPNGYAWTASGTAGGTGPSVALTFPSSGYYTVRLSFRDLAGNVNEVTKSVNVSDAVPVDNRPTATFSLTGKGNGATAKISGGKVKVVVKGKLKVPSGVNAKSACSGTVFLTIKKGKKLISARTAKLSRTCAFSKTISLSKSKVGSAKKLGITVRFQGNSSIKPVTKSLTASIKH